MARFFQERSDPFFMSLDQRFPRLRSGVVLVENWISCVKEN